MQIHMIGHASIFVETQDCKILMDPVLWESHCEGIEDICPKRQVLHDRLPEFDILVISHQHTDHFDIRSLANLPKHVDVLIPKDKIMERCLHQLGYRHIYTIRDFNEVRIGSTKLIPTRSDATIAEFGMIFADGDGVFWNQVDSVVSPQTIAKVHSLYPQIDFLLAGWQPMLENQYQNNRSLYFPYIHYSNNLKLISMVAPKAIAPGANGFQFINGSSWLNQIVFPVSREQFCHDVRQTCPEIKDKVFALDPGDIVTLNNGEVAYLPQKSTFVQKLVDDRDRLCFSPVNLDDKVVDDNSENYDLEAMRNTIEEEVSLNLFQYMREHRDSLFKEYCFWEVVYQLEVVFPDQSQQWYFDFSENPIQCYPGKSPLANAFGVITASSFYGLLKGFKGWDYANMGGYYRCFHKVYQATSHGIIKAVEHSNVSVPDPLRMKFPYDQAYEKARNHEIAQWSQQNEHQQAETPDILTMVTIGNTLIKPLNSDQTQIQQSEEPQLITTSD